MDAAARAEPLEKPRAGRPVRWGQRRRPAVSAALPWGWPPVVTQIVMFKHVAQMGLTHPRLSVTGGRGKLLGSSDVHVAAVDRIGDR